MSEKASDCSLSPYPVVLITGCSTGGIGHELCKYFAKNKYRVVATARNVSKVDFSMVSESEGRENISVWKCDVCVHSDIVELKNRIQKEFGRLDVLVNNAGMGLCGPVAEAPIEEMKKVFDSNVFGAMDMVQVMLPLIVHNRADDEVSKGALTNKILNRQRKIINVGSVTAWLSTPWAGTYCASKAALLSLTDALRLEVAPFGVQVMFVIPGAIKSNFAQNAKENIHMKPHHSLFSMFLPAIERRAALTQNETSTPTSEFCAHLYSKITRTRTHMPPLCVYGEKTRIMWLAHYVLPRWFVDRSLAKRFGLFGITIDPKTVETE